MKILHINQQNERGGAAKVAESLVEELNKKGIKTELWFFDKKGNNSGYSKCIYPFLRGYNKDSLVYKLIKKIVNYYRLYYGDVNNAFFKPVINSIKEFKPDIIHLHNLHGGWVDLNSIAEISKTIKLILTLHDEWLITGHCGATFDCLGWRASCLTCPDLSRYVAIKRSITRKLKEKKEEFLSVIARNNAVLVTPSEWLKKRIIDSGVWKGKEIVVIPNGIDTSKFINSGKDKSNVKEALELPKHKKIGFFVADGGCENSYKDFLTVERTLELMSPDKAEEFTLIIAGDHIENKEISKINNIDVIKLGYLQEKDLKKYYSAVDIFICPSKSDVFPLVVVEAMAAGLPVISTLVGGIPEIIISGETGILIPKQSPNHLLKELINFLDNKYDYIQMGLNARKRIFSHFDLNRMISNYLRLYSQIVKNQLE